MITKVTGCTYYPAYGHTPVHNPLRGGTYYPPTVLFPPLTPTAPPKSEYYDRRITEIIPWLINAAPTKINPY